MFNKERKNGAEKEKKTIEKWQWKWKKHAQEQNKGKKRKQKHVRGRVVELRENVVFTSWFEICIYSFL